MIYADFSIYFCLVKPTKNVVLHTTALDFLQNIFKIFVDCLLRISVTTEKYFL